MKALLDFIVKSAGLDDVREMGESTCLMVEEGLTASLAQAFCQVGEPARCLIKQVRFEGSDLWREIPALELQGVVINLYGDEGWEDIIEKWSTRYHSGKRCTEEKETRVSDPSDAMPDATRYLAEKLQEVKSLAHAKSLEDHTPQAPRKKSTNRL